MAFNIWVFKDGVNLFYKWRKSMPSNQVGKLEEKIDKLKIVGDELRPVVLAGTDIAGISKIRVQGNPKLRPLLCNGPNDINNDFTLLVGAKEVSDKLVPNGCLNKAETNKTKLIADNTLREKYVSSIED